MKLSRRQVLKTLAGSAALAALPRLSAGSKNAAGTSASNPPSTGYLVADAPMPIPADTFHHSACRWCYQKMPLEDLAQNAKRIGLESIELLGPEDWPVIQKYGLTCAMANGVTEIKRGLNRLDNHTTMVPGMITRIGLCADAGLPNVIVFSGNRAGMDDELGLENCAVALKQMMATAEKRKVTVCMELLNSKVNHPDYMCDHTAWGVELVKRVGSERFKLLYDIYHMQIMEGDVIATINQYHPYFGHYHTGGVPGRHEIDDSQELNYAAISRAIKATGFRGYMAQEFIPVRDPMTSLAAAYQLCRV